MSAFKDAVGRNWELHITPSGMRRTKSLTGVHLGTILNDQMKALSELVADPIALIDVLYCLCKPQAEAIGVTEEQFGEGLVGDNLEAATDAFLEALSDFFPSRQGRVLKALWKQMRAAQTTLAEELEQQVSQLTPTDFVSNLAESPA